MALQIDYPITVNTESGRIMYTGETNSDNEYCRRPIVIQGDNLSRRLVVEFTQGDEATDLTGCSAQIKCSFNNNLIAIKSCEIDGNAVIAELTSEMTAQSGEHDIQLTLYNEHGSILSSPIFKIVVDNSITTDEVESTIDFSLLQDLTAEIKSLSVSDEELKNARGTFNQLGERISAAEGSVENTMRFLNAKNCIKRSVGFTSDHIGSDYFYASSLTLSANDGCAVAEGTANKTGIVYALFDEPVKLTKESCRQLLAAMRIKAVGTSLRVYPICGRYQGYNNYLCQSNIIDSNITEHIGTISSYLTIPDGEWVTIWALLGSTGSDFHLGGEETEFNGLGVYIAATTDGKNPKLMIQNLSAYVSDSEERSLIDEIKESVTSNSNRLAIAEGRIADNSNSIENLLAESAAASETINTLSTTLKNSGDTVAEIKTTVSDIQQNTSSITAALTSGSKTISDLQNTVQADSERLAVAENDLLNVESQIEKMRENIETHTNNDNAFNIRISELERKAQTAVKDIIEIKSNIGIDDEVLGLQVDFENGKFTRLAGAVGLSAGADFDKFKMYGGRKRCNVLDDGTITAYYGDENYAENGSNGQVMVYQPAFYYKIVPVIYEKNKTTGMGYHMRKANYYVTSRPHNGFKLHPAFYDADGNEIDYILYSAYEGSMYKASVDKYITDDSDTSAEMDLSSDLICSISGIKPISGLYKNLTRANFEALAANRGTGWHCDTIKSVSANQLLMMIELGTMNTQSAVGLGVVNISDDLTNNCSSVTGATSALGNSTGQATQTMNTINGNGTLNTEPGKVSVSYRGIENPWGNIWKSVNGINIWGDGTMGGGQAYIADDFNFMESKQDGNYMPVGFTLPNADGYIKSMGYSGKKYDWLFLPSEIGGTSSFPAGDYYYTALENLNGYRTVRFGGSWSGGTSAGGFNWNRRDSAGGHAGFLGGRLVYIPSLNLNKLLY